MGLLGKVEQICSGNADAQAELCGKSENGVLLMKRLALNSCAVSNVM